jgi:tetratricopeptide (TPR) repeat protein
MKRALLLLLLPILATICYAQTEPETIAKANKLIDNKKYESAYALLDKFDPDNGRPDVVLLKEDIVLQYFVTSINHQMFGLKDLEKNEDIEDYRGKDGTSSIKVFEVDKALDSLIKAYPNNCKLYKGLGNFYYEASAKYNGQWLKGDEELNPLIVENNKKAIAGGCDDYYTNYLTGEVLISEKKYKEGIPYFVHSIELNKDYADAYYNLAYAYMYTEDLKNALKNAKLSLDKYEDPANRSDAARMMGEICYEMKDYNKAIANYEQADKIKPNDYYNLKPLLGLYVKTGNKKADETQRAFFSLAPEIPQLYNDLEDIYFDNKKEEDLAAFYKAQLPMYVNEPKVAGGINFYLGKIYIDTDKPLAKKYLLSAKEQLSKVYKEDEEVFGVIDTLLKKAE